MTTDHKRIGIMYLWTAFFFFLVGGAMALAIRVQLMHPNNNAMTPDFFNQMMTISYNIYLPTQYKVSE